MAIRRRLLAAAAPAEPPLPAGYKRIEWLESQGAQIVYFTGSNKLNQDSRVAIRFLVHSLTGTVNNIFGARTSTTSNCFCASIAASGNLQALYGSNGAGGTGGGDKTSTVITGPLCETEHIYDFDLNKNELFIDGVSYGTKNAQTFQTPVASRIFCIRGNGASNLYYGSIRVYSYKEWENGTQVVDAVPAIRTSDNVPGLFDRIGERFATNSGSGSFIIPT